MVCELRRNRPRLLLQLTGTVGSSFMAAIAMEKDSERGAAGGAPIGRLLARPAAPAAGRLAPKAATGGPPATTGGRGGRGGDGCTGGRGCRQRGWYVALPLVQASPQNCDADGQHMDMRYSATIRSAQRLKGATPMIEEMAATAPRHSSY